MRLEPVKKYKKPKYPTNKEVQENKELLIKPLDKWKKIGITSALLMTLNFNYIEAKDEMIDMDSLIITAGLVPVSVRKATLVGTTFLSQDSPLLERSQVENMDHAEGIFGSFGSVLEMFFDWLLLQGII